MWPDKQKISETDQQEMNLLDSQNLEKDKDTQEELKPLEDVEEDIIPPKPLVISDLPIWEKVDPSST